MKVGALLDIVRRSDLDDTVGPSFLWSEQELIEYADDAQREACRRARLLVDSTTAALCQIAVVAGTATYALDPRVIRINRARLAGESMPLRAVMVRHLDACMAGWEDNEGTPEAYVTDWQSGAIRLYPTPTAAGTLNLTVVRLPLVPINDANDDFEIRDEYLRNLRHWIVYRARMKRDSETLDEAKATEALALFEREFGAPQPAYAELWANQHYAGDQFDGGY